MLGLVLLYFIGRYFYYLAEDYGKSKWGFAILGVISYYAGTFLFGITFGIFYEIFGSGSIEDFSDIAIGLMALPFGIATCAGLYYLLKRIWSKEEKFDPTIIDQIGEQEG
ncbi:MAG: hypothetical protein AAFP02_02595 [Bacteroidota bacterium]